MLYVPDSCSMRNSKSDSWILQVGAAGNQYPHEKSQYSFKLSIVHYLVAMEDITSIWKLLQFILLLSPLEWQYITYEASLQWRHKGEEVNTSPWMQSFKESLVG